MNGNGFIVNGSTSSRNMVIDNNEIIVRNNGAPDKLYLNNGSGNVVVSVLEITGGSDLAEPFEAAGAESIEDLGAVWSVAVLWSRSGTIWAS